MSPGIPKAISLILVGVLLARLGSFHSPCSEQSVDEPKSGLPVPESGEVRLVLVAGGKLTARLADKVFNVDTPYGQLSIPVEDILQIRFAIRLSAEDQEQVATAISDLGSETFASREAAVKILLQFGEKSMPALFAASKSKQPEVAKRASEVLTKLRSTIAIQRWAFSGQDIIRTRHSWIAGHLEVKALDVHTKPFGQQKIQLMDIAELVPRVSDPTQPSTSQVPDLFYSSPESESNNFKNKNDAVEMQFTDGSMMSLSLQKDQINLQTRYGALRIPRDELVRIRFGKRPAAMVATKIENAIAKLFSDDDVDRKSAAADLVNQSVEAFGALQRLADNTTSPEANIATQILDKLKQTMSDDEFKVHQKGSWDIVQTADCVLRGWIVDKSFDVSTTQFGSQQVSLSNIAGIGGQSNQSEIPRDIQPDPGRMSNYRDKVGQTFYFKVTGSPTGTVWGNGIYTTDSQLATAAIHAGVLKPGETGVVKVKIAGPLAGFKGTSKNGITSRDYGPYPGSYQVLEK